MRRTTFIPATDPRVLLCGRRVVSDADTIRFDWPGTALKLAVRGASRVWIRMDGNKNVFGVVQTSGASAAFPTQKKRVRDYLLPLTLDKDGVTTLTVFKRTEAVPEYGIFAASGGVVTLHGVLLEADSDGSGALLAPAPFPLRGLEVYGDSDSAGFGNEGPRTGMGVLSLLNSLHPFEQDASRSWPLLLGAALDAQVHLIAWSGIGCCWNAPLTNFEPMVAVWDRLLANNGAASSCRDTAWAPDAVLVYLGGNDYYTMGEQPPIGRRDPQRSEARFVNGFAAWLGALRRARPAPTPIFVFCADSQSGACLPSVAQQQRFSAVMEPLLRAAVEKLADAHVELLTLSGLPALNVADDADWGRIGHWSVQGHTKVATYLVQQVGERMGWVPDSVRFF